MTMEIPTIRVEDTDSTAPALTLHYTLGSNSIDTVTVAASIYSLSTHPGRARTEPDEPGTVEVMTCNTSYLTAFWSATASLLDYFADFHATDTPLMQSVWFHLLDTWQAASPVALYKHDHKFWHSHEAQTFKNDYEETLALFQRLVGHPQGQRTRRGYTDEKHTEAVIHAPSGHIEAKAGAYETGPFISGLKPWQQFLCAGAPGFAPSSPSDGDDIVARGAQPSAYDPYTRSIPQPAIALMQSHTSRARTLLARLTHAQNPSDLTQTLAAFDASALAFPSLTHCAHSSASPCNPGTTLSYTLIQGAPPVTRHEGLLDPSMLVERPDLVLLDEAVGNCKGCEAYVPMTGPRGMEGVGFDVWSVSEGRGVVGDDVAGVLGRRGEMFDEWYFGREE